MELDPRRAWALASLAATVWFVANVTSSLTASIFLLGSTVKIFSIA